MQGGWRRNRATINLLDGMLLAFFRFRDLPHLTLPLSQQAVNFRDELQESLGILFDRCPPAKLFPMFPVFHGGFDAARDFRSPLELAGICCTPPLTANRPHPRVRSMRDGWEA